MLGEWWVRVVLGWWSGGGGVSFVCPSLHVHASEGMCMHGCECVHVSVCVSICLFF